MGGRYEEEEARVPRGVQLAGQGPWRKIDRVPVKVLLEVPEFLLLASFGRQGASCHAGSSS